MFGLSCDDVELVDKLRDIVHANLSNENFGVKELAREAGVSRIYLHRKLVIVLSVTPSQFIREIRLSKAMELLKQGGITASEVAYSVGFGSPAYFNTCFAEHYGFPPGKLIRNPSEPDSHKSHVPNHHVQSADRKYHPLKRRKFRLSAWFAVGCVMVGLVILIWMYHSHRFDILFQKEIREKSIVVLPFTSLNDQKDSRYLTEGIMQGILENLRNIRVLKVVPRAAVEKFRNSTLSPQKIAKKLGANYILQGSVLPSGDQVEIRIDLEEARQGRRIWSDRASGSLSELFDVQNDITMKIAQTLEAVMTTEELERIGRIPTRNPAAISYYLKGRYFWNIRTDEALCKSLENLLKATAADPSYARAWSGLAYVQFLMTYRRTLNRPEGFTKAKANAGKAMRLDYQLASAHAVMGALYCYQDWNWTDARKEFLLALALDPNCAIAHLHYSELLDLLGEDQEAREHIDLAIALDPTSPLIYLDSNNYFYKEGKYQEALADCQRALELNPEYNSTWYALFFTFHKAGNDQKAIESLQQAFALDETLRQYSDSARTTFETRGWEGFMEWLIRLEYRESDLSLISLARMYADIGQHNNALNCLELALEKRYPGIPRAIGSRDFIELHSNPRFLSLARRLAIPLK